MHNVFNYGRDILTNTFFKNFLNKSEIFHLLIPIDLVKLLRNPYVQNYS